jgi:hypothetical protein
MSRHLIPAKIERHQVAVGWDNPMSTYFAIVTDETEDDEAVLLWLGGIHDEYPRAEGMVELLKPYADLTADMIAMLRKDRVATLDVGPTPLQRLSSGR